MIRAKGSDTLRAMFAQLSPPHRLLLLKFAAAFAWADLTIQPAEARFVRRLAERLELAEEEAAQVEAWLITAPPPGSLSPEQIPDEHRRVFLETARAVMYVDGDIDEEERQQLEALRSALGL